MKKKKKGRKHKEKDGQREWKQKLNQEEKKIWNRKKKVYILLAVWKTNQEYKEKKGMMTERENAIENEVFRPEDVKKHSIYNIVSKNHLRINHKCH